MQYIISFLEGIITFISPCLLPMLPIYISYFAGGDQQNIKKTLKNALGFVLGFTVVFVVLGALASSIGQLLNSYQTIVNIITGSIVVLFGLHFLGFFNLNIFKGIQGYTYKKDLGFFSTVLFGMIFSIGWTPCVGAFLGSALMLASLQGEMLTGILMLLCYSMGLGIPFIISAVLINELKGAFLWIKNHYSIINKISGILLISVGILMMTGLLSGLLGFLS